jgi:hypothetical protein
MPDQSPALEFSEDRQWFLDRFLPRFRDSADPKIDDIEMVEAKISQVVMNGID